MGLGKEWTLAGDYLPLEVPKARGTSGLVLGKVLRPCKGYVEDFDEYKELGLKEGDEVLVIRENLLKAPPEVGGEVYLVHLSCILMVRHAEPSLKIVTPAKEDP